MSGLFARRPAVPPPPLRGPDYAKKQGKWGEEKARHFLEKELEPKEKRLRTIGRRVRVGRDEIDLVMEPADRILHFENAVPMERRHAVEGLRRRRFRQPRGGAAAVKPVP